MSMKPETVKASVDVMQTALDFVTEHRPDPLPSSLEQAKVIGDLVRAFPGCCKITVCPSFNLPKLTIDFETLISIYPQAVDLSNTIQGNPVPAQPIGKCR